MGNRWIRKICAGCGNYRNLAWDKDRKLCHECLIVNAYRERYNTGVKTHEN